MRNPFKKKPTPPVAVDFEKQYYTNPIDSKMRLETAIGALERTNLVLQNMMSATAPESWEDDDKELYLDAQKAAISATCNAAKAVGFAAEYLVEYHYFDRDARTGERVVK